MLCAQYFGKGEFEPIRIIQGFALRISLISSILFALAALLMPETMMLVFTKDPELIQLGAVYLRYMSVTYLCWSILEIYLSVLRSIGEVKVSMSLNILAFVLNIILNAVFIFGLFGAPKMGVAGVAWATFLCQGISCVLAVMTVWMRLCKIKTKGKTKLFDTQLLKKFATIAIPSTLQQSFISIGNIIIQGVINGFGTDVMAGYSAAVKLNNLVITSFTTLGNGISNFAAQNIGAGKWDRVKAGFSAGLKLVWSLCVPLTALLFLWGRGLMGFFLDEPTELALDTGVIFLQILSPFYFVASAKLVADGILRGAGLMKQFMTATFTDLILRVVLAYILSATALGATGIWCAWPIGWICGALLSICFYRKFENTCCKKTESAV